MSRIGAVLELVSSIAMKATGVATSKGDGDHELESAVGWQFGFYSRPNDGCNGFVLKADGQGNHSVLIAYRDKQYEMALNKGEVGIANAFGAKVLFKNDGTVNLNGTLDDAGTAQYTLPKWTEYMAQFRIFIAAVKAAANNAAVVAAASAFDTAMTTEGTNYTDSTVKHG